MGEESSVYETHDEEIETISSSSDKLLLVPTIRREPSNPDMTVKSIDMGYFRFFLQEMVQIASDFKETFPTYIRDSFAYSLDNNALRPLRPGCVGHDCR